MRRLYLPVPILALTIFTLGVHFLSRAANVYYRDKVAYRPGYCFQYGFTTPIITLGFHARPVQMGFR
jgi:hypothetical protein